MSSTLRPRVYTAVMAVPLISQLGKFNGVAFAIQDGVDDRHAGQPCDVSDDFRQFDIHLLQGLLHVLYAIGSMLHLHLPLPPVGIAAPAPNPRPKRRTQEAVRVQPLDPLRVEHVRIGTSAATRTMPRFHQVDLEALGFKELKQRNQ